MDLDDLLPKKTTPGIALGQEELARLSIEEIDVRVAALEAEIARLRLARTAKEKSLAAANSFFKR